jgi:hypothetical protein
VIVVDANDLLFVAKQGTSGFLQKHLENSVKINIYFDPVILSVNHLNSKPIYSDVIPIIYVCFIKAFALQNQRLKSNKIKAFLNIEFLTIFFGHKPKFKLHGTTAFVDLLLPLMAITCF